LGFTESFSIGQEDTSYMIPRRFQDVTIRVFARDPTKVGTIQNAFRKYLGRITTQQNLTTNVRIDHLKEWPNPI
jgi:hypothetical protein